MPEALGEWRSLAGGVQRNLKKLLAKRLDQPHVPGGPASTLVNAARDKPGE